MELLRKYNTSSTIYFPLVDAGAQDFESTPVTFASGDTQISKDGGAFANTTNNPAHEGNGIYSLVLTATEMQAGLIQVTVIDQTATKEWEDQAILLQTYGNASAGLVFDLSRNHLTAAEVNAEADTALSDYDPPTKTEMDAAFTEIKGATWASGTDTLEAIRDRGDVAWITATGFSTHDAAAVVTAMQAVADDFKADVSGLATAAALASTTVTVDAIAGYLDTEIGTLITTTADIKAKTDQMTFGVTNTLNTNITYVNEIEVGGSGTALDPWSPA